MKDWAPNVMLFLSVFWWLVGEPVVYAIMFSTAVTMFWLEARGASQ